MDGSGPLDRGPELLARCLTWSLICAVSLSSRPSWWQGREISPGTMPTICVED